MSFNQSIIEEAALGWFELMGYAVLPAPRMHPGSRRRM